jgi:hypothetical protein
MDIKELIIGLEELNYKDNAYISSKYLKLNASNSPLTGGLTIQPATNTLTALVVNNNASGNVLTVDTINNRVGIGVVTPTQVLSFGNDAAKTVWIENSAETTVGRALTVNAGSTIAGATTNVAGGNLVLNSGLGKGTGASSIIFQTGRTLGSGATLQTLTTAMTILGNGNVGIGITAPTAKLHIVGSADTQQLIVKANATQTANLQEWQNSSGTVLGSISGGGNITSNIGTVATTQNVLSVVGKIGGISGTCQLYGTNVNVSTTGSLSAGDVSIYGGYFYVSHGSATDNMYVLCGFQSKQAVTTIKNASIVIGISAMIDSNNGSINNYYGVKVGPTTNNTNSLILGTVANAYGIYVNPITGASTLNYAIYTNTGLVRFGDAVETTGNMKAASYNVGATAGIDATVTYVDTLLGAKTLTFVKGLLTAQT